MEKWAKNIKRQLSKVNDRMWKGVTTLIIKDMQIKLHWDIILFFTGKDQKVDNTVTQVWGNRHTQTLLVKVSGIKQLEMYLYWYSRFISRNPSYK